MTGILVAPDLGTVLVERRGIFTLAAENATVACLCPERKPCGGVDIDRLPQTETAFMHAAKDMGQRFIARQKPRGFEFPTSGRLVLHGPFPSYELNTRLSDIETSMIKDAQRRDRNGDEHPECALPLVFERDAFGPYADYVFIGEFLFKDRMTDLEVPDGQ